MPLLLNMCVATACINELLLTAGSAHFCKIYITNQSTEQNGTSKKKQSGDIAKSHN